MMKIYFRKPFLSDERTRDLLLRLQKIAPEIEQLKTETVFYLETAGKLSQKNELVMQRILEITHEPQNLRRKTFFKKGKRADVIEIGPNLNAETPDGRNAVSFFLKCGISNAQRLEKAKRYKIKCKKTLSKKIYGW